MDTAKPDRIEERHAKDAAFHIATETGKWILQKVEDIRALYNSIVQSITELKQKFEELKEKMAQFMNEVERYLQMTKRQLRQAIDEIGEEIDRKMRQYRREMQELRKQGEKLMEEFWKNKFTTLTPEDRAHFNIWATSVNAKTREILVDIRKGHSTPEEQGDMGNIEKEVLTYHHSVIQAKQEYLNDEADFAGKLYQYCYHDTKRTASIRNLVF